MASKALLALPDQTRHGAVAVPVPGSRIIAEDWRSLEQPDLRLAWDALALCASEPNPFFESWYLLPALRALDPDSEITVLRFECEGELAGLLPVRASRRYYGRPLPHWNAWLHGNAFLGTPLIARGLETRFWAAVLDWFDHQDSTSLFAHFTQLPTDGPVTAALRAVCAQQGRTLGLVHREDRALLASPLSAEAYLEAAMPGKKRKELRRQFNRLADLGDVRFERTRGEEHLHRWMDDFLALEHSGWKGTAGSALASHQSTARLFRGALSGAASRGRLERITLWLDDEPIAMLVNFLTPPGAFAYKTAFDERYSRFSPGVLLQRDNLALLDDPAIEWCDSCAAADHPMIDHIWRERRSIGRFSIAVGGPFRRRLFNLILRLELGRNPTGVTA